MYILRLGEFDDWLRSIKDKVSKQKIVVRIQRLEEGNPGDCKAVGAGVLELRISFGPGLRVYCVDKFGKVYVLLGGGDKSTQSADIERAKALAARLEIEQDEEGDWHESS